MSLILQAFDHFISTKLSPEEKKLKDRVSKINPLYVNEDEKLDNLRFVVLDTETTGLNPNNGDRVISLGAVLIENGKIKENKPFYELVNPNCSVPEDIVNLTGIRDDMVRNKPDFTNVLTRFLPLLENSVIVGHAVQFDLDFINRHLQRTCGKKLDCKSVDTQLLARYFLPESNDFSLEGLCSLLDIKCESRHHALFDAISTARLLKKLIEIIQKEGIHTVHDLESSIHCRQLLQMSSDAMNW